MKDDATSAPAPSSPLISSPWSVLLRQWAAVAVDDGWLRLLGAGGHGLPALFTPVTPPPAPTSPALPTPALDPTPAGSSRLLVGFDVLGGTFALAGSENDENDTQNSRVEYFSPDGLEWIDLGLTGLDDLVDWALGGGLDDTFAGLRWPGWRAEIRFLAPDQGVSVYPPLWSEQGQDIAACTRGVAPLLDLVAAHHEAAAQLAGVADGEQVDLRITD